MASVLRRCAVSALLLAGCAPDERSALEACEHGLYWADCGGNDPPVVGCDRTSGACRWFAGGIAARNHAVSDCPISDVCCHDSWPFEDFAPSGAVLDASRGSLSVVRNSVLTRDGVSDVTVVADLAGGSRSLTVQCLGGGGPSSFPCSDVGCGGRVERVGDSIVAFFERGSPRYELEVVLGDSLDQWSVHLYHSAVWMRDPTAMLSCNNFRVGQPSGRSPERST